MRYEWLTAEQIEWLVNPELEKRRMAILNPDCCRVMGAWNGEQLVSFFTIQLFPVLGPMVKIDAFHRDNGEVSRELATRMHAYLDESGARGYMVVADNPVTDRLCDRHGMMKLTSPVYVAAGRNLECNDYTPDQATQQLQDLADLRPKVVH